MGFSGGGAKKKIQRKGREGFAKDAARGGNVRWRFGRRASRASKIEFALMPRASNFAASFANPLRPLR